MGWPPKGGGLSPQGSLGSLSLERKIRKSSKNKEVGGGEGRIATCNPSTRGNFGCTPYPRLPVHRRSSERHSYLAALVLRGLHQAGPEWQGASSAGSCCCVSRGWGRRGLFSGPELYVGHLGEEGKETAKRGRGKANSCHSWFLSIRN